MAREGVRIESAREARVYRRTRPFGLAQTHVFRRGQPRTLRAKSPALCGAARDPMTSTTTRSSCLSRRRRSTGTGWKSKPGSSRKPTCRSRHGACVTERLTPEQQQNRRCVSVPCSSPVVVNEASVLRSTVSAARGRGIDTKLCPGASRPARSLRAGYAGDVGYGRPESPAPTFPTAMGCFSVSRSSIARTCSPCCSPCGAHLRVPWPSPTERKATATRFGACGDPSKTSWNASRRAASSRIGARGRERGATHSAWRRRSVISELKTRSTRQRRAPLEAASAITVESRACAHGSTRRLPHGAGADCPDEAGPPDATFAACLAPEVDSPGS
jgi:hypothetical protein